MRKTVRRTMGLALAVMAVAAACGSAGSGSTGAGVTVSTSGSLPPSTSSGSGPVIIVGSTNFGEQEILAEIYAQVLEANGFPVERKFQLGTREVVNPALKSGQIGMMVEYTGTLLTYEGGTPSTDSAQTWQDLQAKLAPQGLVALAYAPAQDRNGLVVTADTAASKHLAEISDLAAYNGQLVLGGPPECPQREFCLLGLQRVYGLSFASFKPLDVGGPLTVAALEGGEIDVAVLFTSDGVIAAKGFVLLEDDRNLQPADNIVPIVRQALINAYGDRLASLLNPVSAQITTAELSELNKHYSIDAVDANVLAEEWLRSHGLIS